MKLNREELMEWREAIEFGGAVLLLALLAWGACGCRVKAVPSVSYGWGGTTTDAMTTGTAGGGPADLDSARTQSLHLRHEEEPRWNVGFALIFDFGHEYSPPEYPAARYDPAPLRPVDLEPDTPAISLELIIGAAVTALLGGGGVVWRRRVVARRGAE